MSARQPAAHRVMEGLKDAIRARGLGPGDRLPTERDLAAELSASRNTVREAIRALIVMGVLEARQGSGIYLTRLQPQDLLASMGAYVEGASGESIADLLQVRRILEAEAAAMAAARMDDGEVAALGDTQRPRSSAREVVTFDEMVGSDKQFHRTIAEGSGNAILAGIIDALSTHTLRARVWRGRHEADAADRLRVEHGRILAAIENRDPVGAGAAMTEHLFGVEQWVRARPDLVDAVSGSASTGSARSVNVAADTVRELHGKIRSGEFPPGSQLPNERDLSGQLGVSRNSLREAISALTLAGVINSRHGAGTFVSANEPSQILGPLSLMVEFSIDRAERELLEVRRALDAAAAGLAAQHRQTSHLARLQLSLDRMAAIPVADGRGPVMDEKGIEAYLVADLDFHATIGEASKSSVLAAMISAMGLHTARVRAWRGRTRGAIFSRAALEHAGILSAISEQQAILAADLAGAHVTSVMHFVTEAHLLDQKF